ncbi:CPBP family intramembrane glutamic endopeptidase [Hymenobacter latericus]|uniref:CPBP family intramembrane glutamic endopeptidase n=1 Tax=Hymenobacter sp. YIM 151858-1 TaxID=2987688 RepID=UPI00222603E2|nr:type II CAAX endopeptidase family protein [Hymenobacter sp. YIM 151858-1]UYZ58619.1 CPBP family intramembrane metalloprotease [Hymenobacter sp. YIM 151858-1]
MNSPLKIAVGFLVLFALYQLPEGSQFWLRNDYLFLGLMLLMLLGSHLVAKWQGYSGLGAFGLRWHRGFGRNLLLGLVPGLLLPALAFWVCVELGITRVVAVPPLPAFLTGAALFTLGTLAPSMAEDVLTRGYVQRHAGHLLTGAQFIGFTSVLYVLNHIYRLAAGPTTWVFLLVVGVSLALPVVLTRSLWYTVGMHWGMNIVYQLTNNVVQTEAVPGHPNAMWVLTGFIALSIPVHLGLCRRLATTDPDPILRWTDAELAQPSVTAASTAGSQR